MQIFLLALCLSISLLPSLLLRYLPFKPFLTPQQNKRLAFWYGVWFLVLFGIELQQLLTRGPTVQLYKLNIMLGWLPYLAINIVSIPHHLAHHIFVAGMQCIYVMLLHGFGILVLTILEPSGSLVSYYFQQTCLYLLLFALSYPLIKNFFQRVFMANHAINDQKYWRTICLLPLLIVADIIYLSYSDKIMATTLVVPRLLMLPVFVSLMFAFTYDVQQIEQGAELDANNKFLRVQLNSLQNNAHLMAQASRKMEVIRHDTRHYNQLLSTLLREGKKEAALQLITESDDSLQQTAIKSYCLNPIINTALSIYIEKARQEQIPLEYKVELPTTMSLDENRLAILLCNLLENALQASYKQPQGARTLKVLARTDHRQMLLSVANRFDKPVLFGDDGLPVTNRNGHGLGMRSLALFRDMYQATVLCSHKDGWFKTMIYVTNKN